MNFNMVDLIARIEQLETNSINNAAIYELKKSIDALASRLDAVEVTIGKTVNCDAFTTAIMDVKERVSITDKAIEALSEKQASDKKELVNSSIEIAKTIKPPIEPLNYDEEISSLVSYIAKTKSELSSYIDSVSKSIKEPIEPLNYDDKLEELEASISKAIAPIKDIEAKVESSRRTYGEELSNFTLKTNKKIDVINKTLGVNDGE